MFFCFIASSNRFEVDFVLSSWSRWSCTEFSNFGTKISNLTAGPRGPTNLGQGFHSFVTPLNRETLSAQGTRLKPTLALSPVASSVFRGTSRPDSKFSTQDLWRFRSCTMVARKVPWLGRNRCISPYPSFAVSVLERGVRTSLKQLGFKTSHWAKIKASTRNENNCRARAWRKIDSRDGDGGPRSFNAWHSHTRHSLFGF